VAGLTLGGFKELVRGCTDDFVLKISCMKAECTDRFHIEHCNNVHIETDIRYNDICFYCYWMGGEVSLQAFNQAVEGFEECSRMYGTDDEDMHDYDFTRVIVNFEKKTIVFV